jgi:hypothetical protein
MYLNYDELTIKIQINLIPIMIKHTYHKKPNLASIITLG